jgi:hypothetical protein
MAVCLSRVLWIQCNAQTKGALKRPFISTSDIETFRANLTLVGNQAVEKNSYYSNRSNSDLNFDPGRQIPFWHEA